MNMKKSIPFKIRMTDGYFSGEASGSELTPNSMFEVKLNDGNAFYIQAVPDRELGRYTWVSYIEEKMRLVAAIGRLIERHFTSRN